MLETGIARGEQRWTEEEIQGGDPVRTGGARTAVGQEWWNFVAERGKTPGCLGCDQGTSGGAKHNQQCKARRIAWREQHEEAAPMTEGQPVHVDDATVAMDVEWLTAGGDEEPSEGVMAEDHIPDTGGAASSQDPPGTRKRERPGDLEGDTSSTEPAVEHEPEPSMQIDEVSLVSVVTTRGPPWYDTVENTLLND